MPERGKRKVIDMGVLPIPDSGRKPPAGDPKPPLKRKPHHHTEADRLVLQMPHYRRKIMFERAFNSLGSLPKNTPDYVAKQEALLIGIILRQRRLGVMSEMFRVTLQESEDKARLSVAVQRGENPIVIRGVLDIQRSQRPEELNVILQGTINSLRSNAKPRNS